MVNAKYEIINDNIKINNYARVIGILCDKSNKRKIFDEFLEIINLIIFYFILLLFIFDNILIYFII